MSDGYDERWMRQAFDQAHPEPSLRPGLAKQCLTHGRRLHRRTLWAQRLVVVVVLGCLLLFVQQSLSR